MSEDQICTCGVLDVNPLSLVNDLNCPRHGKGIFQVSFYVVRPTFLHRHVVMAQVGEYTTAIARFWFWDKADDLVDRLAQLMSPLFAEALSDRLKELAE